MKSLHLIISGRVQGVGFRDWLLTEAEGRNLSGWVRNLGDHQVEAVISGPAEAVEDCALRCRQGPAMARVTEVIRCEVPPPHLRGFMRLPSVR